MQNSTEIQDLLIESNKTIKDALVVIEKNAQGICFVTNQKKLVGVLTDGDIRRSILDGKSIETAVSDVMQKKFTYLNVNTSQDKIQERLSNAIRHIPLVDDDLIPVDYACFSRMHRTPIMQPLLNGNELAY